MFMKTTATLSAFLLLSAFAKAEEPVKELARVSCPSGGQEHLLRLTREVLREAQESTFSVRLVVLSVDVLSVDVLSVEQGEARNRIWQDLGSYQQGVFPNPAWFGTLLCAGEPGRAWLMVLVSSDRQATVNVYPIEFGPAVRKTFPDPKAHVGALVLDDEQVKPAARWDKTLPDDSCVNRIRSSMKDGKVWIELDSTNGGCAPLKLRLDPKTLQIEEIAS